MTITEAAEKYLPIDGMPLSESGKLRFVKYVTHYESLMRAAGYEWVKVDVQTDADIQKMIPGFGSTRFHLTTADIHKALAIGREQGREWISVEDRLPEIGKWYIVNTTKRGVIEAFCDSHDIWLTAGGDLRDEEYVTHWQPLPPPPKTDKS